MRAFCLRLLESGYDGLAERLGKALSALPGVSLAEPVETNAVFVRIPRGAVAPLQAEFPFYVWEEEGGDPATVEARLMASFDTTEAEVDRLTDRLGSLLGS